MLKVTKISKRDGRLVDFNPEKIEEAIAKAFQSIDPKVLQELEISSIKDSSTQLTTLVLNKIDTSKEENPTVEDIQDLVEKALIEKNLAPVAKSYILYRAERTRIRENKSNLMNAYEEVTYADTKTSNMKRDNGNIDTDNPMAIMLKYGSEGSKQYSTSRLINPKHVKLHGQGSIHIHDMDFYQLTLNCCQIDIIKLLQGGFHTSHGFIREPQCIRSYAALACIAIQNNQNNQHGGQSIPNFDYGMAIGVKKSFRKLYFDNFNKYLEIELGDFDDWDAIKAVQKTLNPTVDNDDIYFKEEWHAYYLKIKGLDGAFLLQVVQRAQKFSMKHAMKEIDKETYQAMESVVFNLCTMHSRCGSQIPFSSLNYGTDTSSEGRMVIKNILLALEAGLGHGETPIFPIHAFRLKEGINFNPGDPNYDLFKLACRVSAKRLFPNFTFQDAPFNLQYYDPNDHRTDISTMGCRTRVIANVYDKTQQFSYSRGNISFTTINLPKIGIESGRNYDKFEKALDNLVEECIEQLYDRTVLLGKKQVKDFRFLMGEGIWLGSDKLKYNDTIHEIIKHGSMSVGFIGLAEALIALNGKHHGESYDSQKLGLHIISRMNDRLVRESRDRQLNFTLFASPAEGLCHRFPLIDRKDYGIIKGITDKDYYTNSFHIPVGFNISIYDKINLEAPYHALTPAGHIFYAEVDGDFTKNLEAFENIIRAMGRAGIGYGAINHPVDQDTVCGYTGIIDDRCPSCNRTEEDDIAFERIRRITGYLATTARFNDGKLAELADRVKHDVTGF